MKLRIGSKISAVCVCCLAIILPLLSSAAELEPIEGIPSKPLDEVLSDITSWLIDFAILICVLVIIWGGINYVASAGDEERIKKSKKTIHYAVFGLAIVGLSYAMIKIVSKVIIGET